MQTWATLYRPKKFSDLALPDVAAQLQHLQATCALPRVMLFTGPRGSGKTSTSRIIAAILNSPINLPQVEKYYLSDQSAKNVSDVSATDGLHDPELDNPEVARILRGESYAVVEIDAASHRGIDDVRAIQEQVSVPPTLSPILVYILDEVHMMSTDAFNALLKLLEQPPRHTFFILATTEFHKIPATVVSRCRVFHFRRASDQELVNVLQKIVDDQKLEAPTDALLAIAQYADGSFRDAVKYLQTVSDNGDITLQTVQKLLTGTNEQLLGELIKIILDKNSLALTQYFARLRADNVNEKFFTTSFYRYLYQQLLNNIKGQKELPLNDKQARFLLKTLLTLPESREIPFLSLELGLLEIFAAAKK